MNWSATWHHCTARRRSPTRSQATSMSQQAVTTVSRRRCSPPRVPAMASSIRARPSGTRPAVTRVRPRSPRAHSSRSGSPLSRASSRARCWSSRAPAGVRLQVAAQQPQPALERVRVQVAQHPLGPGQPAAGGGGVVEVRDPGDAQADGGHRGRDGIPGPPEPGVGPFGVVHAGPGLAQPPQGDAHAVEGLGGLPLGQGGGEGGPGLLPPPGLQGGGPRGQVVLLGHGAKYAHPTRAPE